MQRAGSSVAAGAGTARQNVMSFRKRKVSEAGAASDAPEGWALYKAYPPGFFYAV